MKQKKQTLSELKEYVLNIDGKEYRTKAYSEKEAHTRIRQADEWRKVA